jgi:hypothetical protein
VGQLPSHVSPHAGSTMPLPQWHVQSSSLLGLQPVAQQPSSSMHITTGAWVHTTSHVAALPCVVSVVHAIASLHEGGQFPSHVSPGSTTPLPHSTGQSSSPL